LLDFTSLQNVALVLRSLPELREPDIILEFLKTMQSDPRNGRKLLQLRRRVRKMLRPFQRYNRLWAFLNYTRLSSRKMFIQRSTPDRQMSLPGGGLMIALVGVDGAGKSTLSAEIKQWLGWKVDLFFYYQGSKHPSIWTDWSYILFRMARRGHRELSTLLGESNFIPKWIASVRQSLLALHYLFVGRDRYKRYRLAKAQAANGSVVIFDRFPLVAPLDGPEIHLIEGGCLNIVSKFLSHIEIGLYQKYEPVDLLLVLNVSLDTSLQRKPDHPRETILAKNAVLNQVKANLTEEPNQWNWVLIDAEKPLDEVLLDVKRTVWAAL
jgi:thymidylate kinase